MHPGARYLPPQHLSVRVPWHDTGWTGTVCTAPAKNTWCMILKGIRDRRELEREHATAGRSWVDEPSVAAPACALERGAVLNSRAYSLRSRHPFATSSPKTHGHFGENDFQVPPSSVVAIPYRWARQDDAEKIARALSLPFDRAREPQLGFDTPWLNDFENQSVMLDTFFGGVAAEQSLVFFYAKRTPLADDPRRVLLGVGSVCAVGPSQEHAYLGERAGRLRGLMWERTITHSVRPDGVEGFLLPYQDLLEHAEEGGIDPAQYVAFAPNEAFDAFSNVAEHVSHDHAISCLVTLVEKVRLIEQVIPGPWARRLEWLDLQLARLWRLRGPFPGLGSALHAFDIRYGTLMAMDLAGRQAPDGRWGTDPWRLVDSALSAPATVLSPGVARHVQPMDSKRLAALAPDRRRLLELLSRFNLTIDQAKRFFDPALRPGLTDQELLSNPYRFFEHDRPRPDAVSIGTLDRGMFPDESVRLAWPLPEESRLEGDQDLRRVRALVVSVLDAAESEGHTLLPAGEILGRVGRMELDPPCRPTADLLPLLEPALAPIVVGASLKDESSAWQFAERKDVDELIRLELTRRRGGRRHVGAHDWRSLVDKGLGPLPTAADEREIEERARTEKAAALGELFAARFSLLLGPAGTGKTRLLQMLCSLPEVSGDGILLLAPTGKARVQMQASTGGLKAQTIAQFLRPDRYDGETQRYHLSNAPKVDVGGTIIIDECSMVTEDQLAAVLEAARGPKRVILVGDHRQLPPIGAGRPLVDIAREFAPPKVEDSFPRVGPGYVELTVHRRQVGKERDAEGRLRRRDDLLLASWFGGEAPDPGADEIWGRLASGQIDGHLSVRTWQTDDDLQRELLEAMVEHIPEVGDQDDARGFAASLGGVVTDKGVFFNARWEGHREGSAAACERWQVLSPVRGRGHGVDELNRSLHERFRREGLEWAQKRSSRTPHPAGAQRIIYGDKVMSTVNDLRGVRGGGREPVSNGEIGIVVGEALFGNQWKGKTSDRIDVEFRTQLGKTFCYWPGDFGDDGSVVLELAYALTIHKSQGSQFGTVFVILPQPCFILSRELVYTALTRQLDRVVLLVQGQVADLRAYASARYSEVARRYTNLFAPPSMIADDKGGFLERRLIHRTTRGELVRSISEVVVADALHAEGIDYQYEKPLRGADGIERYPDFTAEDPATGILVYWEHLGMLSNQDYTQRWIKKLSWYAALGLIPNGPENAQGARLVTSENRLDGAIDAAAIRARVREVFGLG